LKAIPCSFPEILHAIVVNNLNSFFIQLPDFANFVEIDQKIDALQNCLLKIIDLIVMDGTT